MFNKNSKPPSMNQLINSTSTALLNLTEHSNSYFSPIMNNNKSRNIEHIYKPMAVDAAIPNTNAHKSTFAKKIVSTHLNNKITKTDTKKISEPFNIYTSYTNELLASKNKNLTNKYKQNDLGGGIGMFKKANPIQLVEKLNKAK